MLAVLCTVFVTFIAADEAPLAGKTAKCFEPWTTCTMDAAGTKKADGNFMSKHGVATCDKVVRPDSKAVSTIYPDIAGKSTLDVAKHWAKTTKSGKDWAQLDAKPADFKTKEGNLLYIINHSSKAKKCEKITPTGKKAGDPYWQDLSGGAFDVTCLCIQQQKDEPGNLHLVVDSDGDNLVGACESAGCTVKAPTTVATALSGNSIWYPSKFETKVASFGFFLVGGLLFYAVSTRKNQNDAYTKLVEDEI